MIILIGSDGRLVKTIVLFAVAYVETVLVHQSTVIHRTYAVWHVLTLISTSLYDTCVTVVVDY